MSTAHGTGCVSPGTAPGHGQDRTHIPPVQPATHRDTQSTGDGDGTAELPTGTAGVTLLRA